MTNLLAYKILTEHTRNYVGLYDMEALEVAIEAVEKQIPKKTLWGGTNNSSWRSCPVCHSRQNKTYKFCTQCGQALEWEAKDG